MRALSRVPLLSLAILLSAVAVLAQAPPTGAMQVIPVVGSTAGAHGAQFRTELQLQNPTGATISGTIVYHPAGQPGSPADPQLRYSLDPFAVKSYADVVAEMGQSGLGSMDVVADSGMALPDAVVRAYNTREDGGTTGSSIPVLSPDDAMQSGDLASLIVPADLGRYRLNVGIRTLGEPTSIRLRVYGSDGTQRGDAVSLSYPANYFEQKPVDQLIPFAVQPNDSIVFEIESGSAFVYGTNTDNRTNDPSVQIDRFFGKQHGAKDQTVETDEDTPVDITLEGVAPGRRVLDFSIVSGPAHGTLSSQTRIDDEHVKLTYTPSQDYNGTDSFDFQVSDPLTGKSDQATVHIIVHPVNDAPTAQPNSVTADEDTQVTVDLIGADVDHDTLTYSILTPPSHGTLDAVTKISDLLARVDYTPDANYNGSDSFEFQVSDGSLTATATVTIDVRPVDDAPVATADSYTLLEDQTLNEAAPGVLANDTDTEGDPLTAILVSGASHGTVTLNADGSFTYVPVADYFGSDAFTYKSNDGTLDSGVVSVSLTITPVNDAPSFAKGADQTVLEDSGAHSVSNWATAISAGPNEATQTVVFNVTGNSNPALFSTAPAIAPNGTLTFTSAPDANGSATITIALQDNGGTANGGVDTSATQTFTITVTAVNDAPVFTKGADQTVLEDAGAQTIANWASAMSAGPSDESTQTVAFNVTANSNAALFSAQPAISPSGTLTYTPAANAYGSATITIALQDDGGTANGGVDTSATQTFVINVTPVNDAPSFTGGANQTVLEDAGAQSITNWATAISAGPNEATQIVSFVVDSNSNPALFASGPAVSSNGTLTWTPALNANGSATITLHAMDDGGTANGGVDVSPSQTFTLTVTAVNDAPSFTSGGDVTVAEDSGAYSSAWASAMSAGPADETGQTVAFAITGNTNPALFSSGPAIDAAGNLTFSTAANANGSATVTVTLSDNGGTANGGVDTSAPVSFTITLTPVNDAPVAVADAYATNEDTPLNVAAAGVLANDTDVDGDPLSAIQVSGPANGSLTLNPDGSFTYTPNANYNGSDSFTYKANDGSVDSNVVTVSITINAVNDPPVAGDDSYTTAEDTPMVVAAPGVLGNDSDVESDPLTAVLVTSPAHGSLTLNPDGSFSYTPALNYNGPDSFTYEANDGTSNSNVATVSITVTAVNDAPVAVDDSYSTNEDTPLNVLAASGVLANDTDVDGDPLTAILVAGPSNGGLTLNADGSFSYTPNANYNGSDSFTYKANDGSLDSNVATVTITINAVNDPPVATGDSYTTTEDTPLNVVAATGVLANDTDPESDPLTAVLVSAPSNGTLTLNADGSFTYTPSANFNGSDSFTYKANDGTSDSNVATVAINVTAVNDPPVANGDSFSVNEDTPLPVAAPGVLANDTDVENDPLVAVLVSGPANAASFTLNADGSFSYTPNPNFNGADSFTYKANDGSLDSNVATVTITVNPVDDAPVNSVPAAQTMDQGTTLTFSTGGGNAISISDVDAGVGAMAVTLTASDGTLSLSGTAGLSFTTGSGTNDSTMTFTGTVANVNVALEGMTYTPGAAFFGSTSVTITTSDQGNTGAGGPLSDSDSVAITVNQVNQPPVNSVPAAQTIDEDTSLTFSTANSNLISISDPDAGSASVQVTLGVTNGTLTLSGTTNLTFTTGTGTADATMTFTGTIADINNALAGLVYSPPANYNGTETLTILTDDLGNTGPGGNKTDTDSVTITINAVDDAPVLTAPGSVTIDEDNTQTFSGTISVADVDAGSNPIAVSLSVSHGNIALASLVGLSITSGADGTSAVAFTGTLTDVNSALNGLVYTPAANYNGSDALAASVNDQGYTGSGGPLADNSSVAITINAVNDPPTATAAGPYGAYPAIPISFAAGTLGGTDVDAGTTVTIDTAPVATTNGFVTLNTDGSFTFTPSHGAAGGTASFQYRVCDDGSPAPGLCSSAVTVTFNVSSTDVYFVKAAGSGTGCALGSECTLATALTQIGAATGKSIFIGDAANHSTAVTLNTGGALVGEGATASFDTIFGINSGIGSPGVLATRPATNTTAPTIQQTVTLAASSLLRGVTVSTSGATAVSGGAIAGPAVSEVTANATTAPAVVLNGSTAVNMSFSGISSSSSGSSGVSLTNVTGNFIALGGTLSNATAADFLVSGGTANVTYAGSISDATGTAVSVANATGGTKTFSGAIGSGSVSLTSNTGATISFTGALTLSTSMATAFTATGGGIVTATNTASTITTTSGTAVNVSNTTIGGGGLTFQRIDHSGNNTTIALTNTGSGPFTVSGSGTTAGSGGTIQNTVGADAVTLNNTGGVVTLKYMTIQDITAATDAVDGEDTHSNVDAIQGQNVNGGLTLDNVTIQRISDNGVNGSIDGAPPSSTTWNGLTLSNCTFTNTNRFNTSHADANNEGAVYIQGIKGIVSVTGSSFSNAGNGLILRTASTGTLDMTVRSNSFTTLYKEIGTLSVGNFGIDVIQEGSLSSTIRIGDTATESNAALGNVFTNGGDRASIRIISDTGSTGAMKSSVAKNTFTITDHTSPGTSPGSFVFNFPQGGVLLRALGSGNYEAIFASNVLDQVMHADGGLGQLTMLAEKGDSEFIVRNNTFRLPWDAPVELRADGAAGGQNSAKVLFTNNTYVDGTVGSASDDLGAPFPSPYTPSYTQVRNNGRLDLTVQNDGPFGLNDPSSGFANSFHAQTTSSGDVLNLFLLNTASPLGYQLKAATATTYNLFRNGSGSGTAQGVLQDNNNTGGGGADGTTPPVANLSGAGTVTLSGVPPPLPNITQP
ncbi:MAG: Ig-like domain-containing protein [Thermoanaerobaculia bacterium]